MNYTTASCGHSVPAVGAPGSEARKAVENQACDACCYGAGKRAANGAKAAGVAGFVKQFGANIVTRNDQVEDEFNGLNNGWPDPHVEYDIHGFRENYQGADCRIRLRDPKGGDWNEWPLADRAREWPKGR